MSVDKLSLEAVLDAFGIAGIKVKIEENKMSLEFDSPDTASKFFTILQRGYNFWFDYPVFPEPQTPYPIEPYITFGGSQEYLGRDWSRRTSEHLDRIHEEQGICADIASRCEVDK